MPGASMTGSMIGPISALQKLSDGKTKIASEVADWVIQVQRQQNEQRPLTVLEHTALAYMLRRAGEKRCQIPGDLHQRIKATLARSWLYLTGKHVESEGLMDRLPWLVLCRASREERLFHAAAFQRDGPTAAQAPETIGRDYVPEVGDFVAAAAFLVLSLTGIGGVVLGSLCVGYVIASVAEYGMHRWAGHEAGGPFKPMLAKAGWAGERISAYLQATYWGHFVVHHVRTCNKHYTAQFASSPPGDQATLDADLAALGPTGSYIRRTDYGMTLSHEGVIAGFLLTMPMNGLLWWALSLDLISGMALVAPSLLYVGASARLHPYLHKSRSRALAQADPLMRWLLSTRYAEWISRAHWVHHKGGGANFNLVPGADLIFGDLRKPTLSMILRMREDQIIGACWDQALDGPSRCSVLFGQ